MPSSRQILLVVPGFATNIAAASRAPVLERLLARGERRRVTERETGPGFLRWHRGVLGGCGLIEQVGHLASAPLERYGRTGRIEPGWWMHAAPVHLRAGIADVVLEPVCDLSIDELQGLQSQLQECLGELGAVLWPAGDGAWFLQAQQALGVSLPPAAEVAGAGIRTLLCSSAVEPTLLRLLTELQMLLHEHPVNRDREQRGLTPANAIWLWGGGMLTTHHERPTSTSFRVAQDYLRGLARWLGAAIDDVAGPRDALASVADRVLVEATDTHVGRLDGEWIAPLVQGLAKRDYSRLTLVLDDWLLELDARSLRRFWRGRRPLKELEA